MAITYGGKNYVSLLALRINTETLQNRSNEHGGWLTSTTDLRHTPGVPPCWG